MNKEKALKNQGLEFREDISVKGGRSPKQFYSARFRVLRKAKAGKSAKRGTQPQTILFGSVSGLKKS